jgi:hypothetical protein
MSFAAITLCVASQQVPIVVVVVYFVIDSVRKLLDTPSYSPQESGPPLSIPLFCLLILLSNSEGSRVKCRPR